MPGYSDSIMRLNCLIFHQSRLMELSAVFQLATFFVFSYWFTFNKLDPQLVAYFFPDSIDGFIYCSLMLIAGQLCLVLKILVSMNEALYPTAQNIKFLRGLILVNGYILFAPTLQVIVYVIHLCIETPTVKFVLFSIFGSILFAAQALFNMYSLYLHVYFKMPLHQGIGRYDRNSQMGEVLLVIIPCLCSLFHSVTLILISSFIITLYLCYRGTSFPSFQSVYLCQLQLASYWTYLCFIIISSLFYLLPEGNIDGLSFTLIQILLLFAMLTNSFKYYMSSFVPNIDVLRITQSYLKGQLTYNEYIQKIPLLINTDSFYPFVTAVHFLSNFNLVEEFDSDTNSTGSHSRPSQESNVLLTRHKGHYLVSNAVYNCLIFGDTIFDKGIVLKKQAVRYCWMNFGMIEDKSRAIELENQLILGKRNILANYTLVLVSTIRKLKDLAEFSTENDLTLLMKNSYEIYCTKQMKSASASLYTILKAIENGKDLKIHLLSQLFVSNAQKSFVNLKKLFQKHPQDPTTLKLLTTFLNSIENDTESGDFISKTIEMFDTNRGIDKDILDMSAIHEESDSTKQDNSGQFDYVGKFLIINENMKRVRFGNEQWQSRFHYLMNFAIFVLFVSLIICIILNGYTLIDYFQLQLSFSQLASILPVKRQKADTYFIDNNDLFTPSLLELEDFTTDLVYLGRTDGYDTIRFLDTSSIWSPNIINATAYTLSKSSFLDTNLDQITIYASSLLPDIIKRTFITFSTFTASVSQIVRLSEYHQDLELRLTERNYIYFEYTLFPTITLFLILVFFVAMIYTFAIKRERSVLLTEVRAKCTDALSLAAYLKGKIFSSSEEQKEYLTSVMETFNLKIKSRSKNHIFVTLIVLFSFGLVLAILSIVYVFREDAMQCAYFQSNLSASTSSVLFAFYHLQTLGRVNLTSQNILNKHYNDFLNASDFAISLMETSTAQVTSYIRNPYFAELSHYEEYKSLIFDKNCVNDVCEESLDFEVNQFTRSLTNCLFDTCTNLQDVLDTALNQILYWFLRKVHLFFLNNVSRNVSTL
eukprot:NODE_2_length_91304_cov_0.692462.p3 type:complete len:1043 gc:universal NODE_2_length_91304_cov_0.692462:50898-54026(+)